MQMEQSKQIYLQLKKINENMLMIMPTANIINKEGKKSTTIHNNNNMQITTNKKKKKKIFKCLTNTRPQNTTTNINLKQII